MSEQEDLRARAKDLLMKGDTAGGITDLKEVLSADPEDAEIPRQQRRTQTPQGSMEALGGERRGTVGR